MYVEDHGSTKRENDAFRDNHRVHHHDPSRDYGDAHYHDEFRANVGAFQGRYTSGGNIGDDVRGEDEDHVMGGDDDDARDQDDSRDQGQDHPSGRRKATFEQVDGREPMTFYPSDIADALPWESTTVDVTLATCTSHHKKLRDDLTKMDLPTESQQSLQILLESLGKFIDVYKSVGPMTDCFIHLMRMRKAKVTGPDKWVDVDKRVSKEDAI